MNIRQHWRLSVILSATVGWHAVLAAAVIGEREDDPVTGELNDWPSDIFHELDLHSIPFVWSKSIHCSSRDLSTTSLRSRLNSKSSPGIGSERPNPVQVTGTDHIVGAAVLLLHSTSSPSEPGPSPVHSDSQPLYAEVRADSSFTTAISGSDRDAIVTSAQPDPHQPPALHALWLTLLQVCGIRLLRLVGHGQSCRGTTLLGQRWEPTVPGCFAASDGW